MKMMMERIHGCLLGGAVGDALGAPAEFLSMDEIRRRYGPEGITGYVEFWSSQGAFTDDTQMTLFTAEGLIAAGAPGRGVRSAMEAGASVHRSYLRWLLTQGQEPVWGRARTTEASLKAEGWLIKEKGLWARRGPGMTCLGALRSGRSGSTADPINVSKGCGGVMRVAPVGLWCRNPEEAFRTGCEVAAVTHGNAGGYLPAGFLASIIADLKRGEGLEESIQRAIALLKTWDGHGECLGAVEQAVRAAAAGSGKPNEGSSAAHASEEPRAVRISKEVEKLCGKSGGPAPGGGWTGEEALSIALYCSLSFSDDFRRGVLAAVNHDGDSDSTGAITGNILGAKLGKDAIPREWITGLDQAAVVERMARELCAAASG
jgi:ADP-ribosylglycohydrolase